MATWGGSSTQDVLGSVEEGGATDQQADTDTAEQATVDDGAYTHTDRNTHDMHTDSI